MNKTLTTTAVAALVALAAGPALSADATSLDRVSRGNIDMGGLDYPATLQDPVTGRAPRITSLDDFLRGSHDGYQGDIRGNRPQSLGGDHFVSTMERAMAGHDLGYQVPNGTACPVSPSGASC